MDVVTVAGELDKGVMDNGNKKGTMELDIKVPLLRHTSIYINKIKEPTTSSCKLIIGR